MDNIKNTVQEVLKGWYYGNSTRYTDDLCYVVVPKCASSVIIEQLEMIEGPASNYKIKFTFIREPYSRLKSFIWQQKARSEEEIKQIISKVIKNFHDYDEHCYPYSHYIKFQDFDFIGTIENFNHDIRKITNDENANKIFKQHQPTLSNKTDIKYVNFEKKCNEIIEKNKKILNQLYEMDFELYQKVKNAY